MQEADASIAPSARAAMMPSPLGTLIIAILLRKEKDSIALRFHRVIHFFILQAPFLSRLQRDWPSEASRGRNLCSGTHEPRIGSIA